MTRYDPDKHHRRSIRLKGYDYTLPGAYFVTIVTHGRELLFDDAILHRVVETFWQRIPGHTLHVELDEWVVMPNHLHGIIIITDPVVGATHSPLNPSMKRPSGPATGFQSERDQHGNASPLQATGPPSGSLGAIIGNFKSVTTRRINRVRHSPGLRVWQRNYYERIIRNERELNAIRQYICDNPSHWADDEENPARIKGT
ncbi:MAG: transposase [Chloroflexota bacterium]|nr:transposase [Anaerolineae bacterium]